MIVYVILKEVARRATRARWKQWTGNSQRKLERPWSSRRKRTSASAIWKLILVASTWRAFSARRLLTCANSLPFYPIFIQVSLDRRSWAVNLFNALTLLRIRYLQIVFELHNFAITDISMYSTPSPHTQIPERPTSTRCKPLSLSLSSSRGQRTPLLSTDGAWTSRAYRDTSTFRVGYSGVFWIAIIKVNKKLQAIRYATTWRQYLWLRWYQHEQ